ncbi:DUF58 domain-containing protein [uncultured Microbacterium sp.]|uniref:DUF58 domain-containing protein n=1 Tax=uncultured Microbacterium sp. TaxID=191216 RepID=UPI00262E7AA0|nr:DUF58 domain-containing protein [uncultured Microbacterium sp.]
MRGRRPLTPRGLAAVIIGVVCAIAANVLSAPILLYLAVLFFSLVVAAVLAIRAPRRDGAVARRISTDLLAIGEESAVAVRFDLRPARLPHGIWHDRLPPAVSGDTSGELPTDNGTSIRYSVTGVRRGVWPIGPLSLRTVDPFGLAQRVQDFGDTRTVTVVPEVVPLPAMGMTTGSGGGNARTSVSRLGPGSDNLSPRQYLPGDSMRRIHWRATAHRGELMVRQEEEESSPDAVVILDRAAARWSTPSEKPDAAFEAAVSACASIALHLAQEGYSVDVLDTGGTSLGCLRGHDDDRDGLLVALAMVSPRGEGRDVVSLLDENPPGVLVLITGALEEADARALRSGGASCPILLTTDASPEAVLGAQMHGWSAAFLGDDVAEAWTSAVPAHLTMGGAR